MGRSWTPLGALLEAFGAQKTLLGSALGRPKGTKETGFALPEGQMSAQKGPWRVLKLAPKANQAENGKPTRLSFPGARCGSKIGSESHLRRGSPQKASWRPLGTLLEPLGALLDALRALLEPKTLRLEPKTHRLNLIKWCDRKAQM